MRQALDDVRTLAGGDLDDLTAERAERIGTLVSDATAVAHRGRGSSEDPRR